MSNVKYSLYEHLKSTKIKKTYDCDVLVFKPTFYHLFLKGYCKTIKDYFFYLFWLITTNFKLTIYYVKEGDTLIHTSLVSGKSLKFPFMKNIDLHIGPCFTVEKYRGLGIYPKVLKKIAMDFNCLGKLYMIIRDDNISSIKGVIKAGFAKISSIEKKKLLFFYKYFKKEIDGWKYYNHAAIPTCAPNEKSDLRPIKNRIIWNIDGKYPLFARWTTDYDCQYDTEWWYTVKDTEYDISKLTAKKRYNINKGIKNFEIRIINPKDYKNEILEICCDAFCDYSKLYLDESFTNEIIKSIDNGNWDKFLTFGAFTRNESKLCAFYTTLINNNHIDLVQLKAIRSYEKDRVNYALIDGVLSAFNKYVKHGYYISNGCRNLVHKTNFNEFLCNNFGFRKAYCKLHIAYRPVIKPFVNLLYLFRRTINSLKNKSPLLYKLNSVLQMEAIARKCRISEANFK